MKTQTRRWAVIGGAIAVAAVAAVALLVPLATADRPAQSPLARPPAPRTPSATAAPEESPSPSPSAPSGEAYVTWEVKAQDIAEGTDPAIMSVVDAGKTWLAVIRTGDIAEGLGQTVLAPLAPATGELLTEGGEAQLPESVACAQDVYAGQVLCAWAGSIHRVDPSTAKEVGEPIEGPEGISLYGVEVAGDLI
ncbi:MAG: hypothetical protein LBJ08_08855, partial [Bifidobacteriaceae bacterium]|nr:hypothetical protein [Bifidobacteriaceae bacterium]